MILTLEQYLNRLAEKSVDNTKQLRKQVQQRRNGMEDLYGVMFSAEGDADNPARFYISLSPDYVYLEQLAFKFVIRPYTTTVKGGTSSATVEVDDTSLAVSGGSISPNPHSHGTQPHTHNVIKGKAFVHTTSDYWRVRIGGIDITSYLMEQHDGDFIDGEGIFPNDSLGSLKDFYDILDVISMMYAEGDEEAIEAILPQKPKMLLVEIVSDAPFGVDAYLYTKYSHLNR